MTKQDTLATPVNTWVFCTVHGAEGWSRMLAVRPRDGYIKISGFNHWCPPYNFALVDRQNKTIDGRTV